MPAKRFGVGEYRYEVVRNWPKVEIRGVAADVCVDRRGNVYTCVRNPQPDGSPSSIGPGTGTMLVLDRDGNLKDVWAGNAFSAPHGLWCNEDGEVFHADTGLHTVTKYDARGRALLQLGTKGRRGRSGRPFNMPTRAKQAPNGDIFVSDGYGQNRVHRFTARGEHVLSFGKGDPVFYQKWAGLPVRGKVGAGPGEFNLPHDVNVGPGRRVYVCDRENKRIQVFSMEGRHLATWDEVRNPNDSFIDSDGVMHTVSAPGVELRNLDGTLVGRWGEKGPQPGQFLNSPHGLWIEPDGTLYIAEVGGNNRLQKFVRV
jgi:DNA-binding beta-propeller fold protein YncE